MLDPGRVGPHCETYNTPTDEVCAGPCGGDSTGDPSSAGDGIGNDDLIE
jgi:hypothetical protein